MDVPLTVLKFSNSVLPDRTRLAQQPVCCCRQVSARPQSDTWFTHQSSSMSNLWGDILFSDNPQRREQVKNLVEVLKSNVEAVYTTCVNMSLTVNRMNSDYNVVPPIDLEKTYDENFDILTKTFEQWAKMTDNPKNGEKVTAETKNLIDDINSATDAKAFTEHAHTIIKQASDAAFWSSITIILVVGALVTKLVYHLIVPAGRRSWMRAALGLIGGAAAGAAVGVVVDMVIGALDGARERSELEARIAELVAAREKLHPEVTNLQKEVTGIMLKLVELNEKSGDNTPA